jgi:hypothetical protein
MKYDWTEENVESFDDKWNPRILRAVRVSVAVLALLVVGLAVARADPGDDITVIRTIPLGSPLEPEIDGGWMRDPLFIPAVVVTLPHPLYW